MPTGVLIKWVAEKGFGFIKSNEGGEDVFVHVADLLGGEGSVQEGDEVRFDSAMDERKGKPRAAQVELAANGRGGGGGGRRGRSRSRSPPRRRNDSRSRDGGRGGGGRGGGGRGGGGEETGKLLRWNTQGGFGFIQPNNGGEDLFCHVSGLRDGEGSVRDGEMVTFTREFNDRKGKDQAVAVARSGGSGGGGGRSPPRRKDSRSPPRRRRNDSRDRSGR